MWKLNSATIQFKDIWLWQMTEDPAKFCANRKRVCSRSTILSFLPAFAKNSCSTWYTAKACCHMLEYKYAPTLVYQLEVQDQTKVKALTK